MSHKTKPQLEAELKAAQARIAELERALKMAAENPPAADDVPGEEKLRRLLELLPVGVSILNGERQVVFQNSALSQILQLTPEGLKTGAYNNRRYLAADGRPMPADGFASEQAATSGQAIYDVETGIILENGDTLWTNVSAVPVNLPDWKMVVVTTNITRRKQVERALQESNQKYSVLFEKSAVPAALTKMPEGVFADVNEAFQSVYGYSREEVIGKTSVEIGMTRPGERSQSIADLERLGTLRDSEKHLFARSGEVRIGAVNINKVLINGQNFVVTTIHDVTERKRIEIELTRLTERFNLAAGAAGIGVWDWDIRRNEIVWDDQMYALYGITPNEFGGAYEAWLNGVYPDDREPSNAVSAAAVRGEREYDTEFRVLWPDGSVHWLKANGKVFRAADGQPTRMVGVNFDITQRKQLENNLRESEQKYTLLFEKSAIPVFLLKLPEVVIVAANEAAEQLTGFAREEMLGKNAAQLGLISPRQRAETISQFEKDHALAANELRLTTKTGEERFIVFNTNPLLINGQPFAITSMLDITARKQAEEKLQDSEIKFRALFENSPMQGVIWKLVRDLQGEIVDWEITDINPLGAASIGLQPAEAIGKRAVELFGVEGMTAYLETSRQIAASGQPLLFETHFDANGRDYLSSDFLVGRGHYANISIDITDRKTMEQQLRASERNYRELVQNANSAILRWQGDGTITFFNEFAQAFFGYAAADVLGKPVGLLVPETDSTGGDLSTLVRDIATHPEQFVNVINENIRRDGSRVWMAWTNKPIYDETGQVAEILAVGADITDRKRVEDDLRRSNAELEQFAYVASHDLQEPLRTVAGMMQLLQQRYQGQLDARADEYIHYAVDASNRMQQLINDLLEFSRVERRGHPFAATDLEKVLHTALANLQGAITDSGAQITHDPLPIVQADAGQLTQVLQNLISNSIKYRGERPPEIHLSATRLEHGWQLAVRDNGIGIEPQYFDRVFLIFQRLHTRSKYPGTGIGLALCKKIVERHGGKMWIESALNQGATFFFTIPERS